MQPRASEPDFLATCWTTAGNVMPLRTGPRSTVPIERRISAAATSGYKGIGFNVEDILTARESLGYSGITARLRDYGMKHLELEFLDNWWTDSKEEHRNRQRLLDAAGQLGAHHIKVGAGLLGQIVDRKLLECSLHELAEQAQAVGVKIALEAAAFSMLPTIDLAAELVNTANHPNAGLLLDVWHVYRGGTDYRHLPGMIASGSIFAVELDDGLALPADNLYEDTFDHRKLCGEGDFDVVSFIQTLCAMGYDGPWGVEMMSAHHRTLEPEAAAGQALEAALECFTQAMAYDDGPVSIAAAQNERLYP